MTMGQMLRCTQCPGFIVVDADERTRSHYYGHDGFPEALFITDEMLEQPRYDPTKSLDMLVEISARLHRAQERLTNS